MVFIEYFLKKFAKYFIITILPFFTFAKGSLYFYLEKGQSTWTSFLYAGLISLAILTIYGMVLDYKINEKFRLKYIFVYSSFPLIIVAALYGLFHISEQNSKTDNVKEHYTKLHPLIRPTVALIILIDKNLILTETKRKLEDYKKMGLENNYNSLHFVQKDSYVHAVDIRTLGRPEWKNFITKWYFKIMGLHVVRHVGSADHLHIALPLRT